MSGAADPNSGTGVGSDGAAVAVLPNKPAPVGAGALAKSVGGGGAGAEDAGAAPEVEGAPYPKLNAPVLTGAVEVAPNPNADGALGVLVEVDVEPNRPPAEAGLAVAPNKPVDGAGAAEGAEALPKRLAADGSAPKVDVVDAGAPKPPKSPPP